MSKKYTITYREALAPITDTVTKFGGQPVWLDTPTWPVSRMYGSPMQFVCQIALDPALFGELPTRMAYLFITDWNYEGVFPETFDPDGGENALILQPGGKWDGTSLPQVNGPSLSRRAHRAGRWEHTPCEFATELRLGDDLPPGAWDHYPAPQVSRDAYWAALLEDKVGGTPIPTPFGPRFGADFEGWRLLLQLNTKDNAEGGENNAPFYLNFADDGVGYGFISADGRSGKFLWSR